VTIFYSDWRHLVLISEDHYLRARQKYQINFLPSKVEQLTAAEKDDNLIVKFSCQAKEQPKEFDLVVLSTGIVVSRHNKELAVRLVSS